MSIEIPQPVALVISKTNNEVSTQKLYDWTANTPFTEASDEELRYSFLLEFYPSVPVTAALGEEKYQYIQEAQHLLVEDLVTYAITEETFNDALNSLPTALTAGEHKDNPQSILEAISQHPHKDDFYEILSNFAKMKEYNDYILQGKVFDEFNFLASNDPEVLRYILENYNALRFLLLFRDQVTEYKNLDLETYFTEQDEKILDQQSPSYVYRLQGLNNKFEHPMGAYRSADELCKILFPLQHKLGKIMMNWLDEAEDRRDYLDKIASLETNLMQTV